MISVESVHEDTLRLGDDRVNVSKVFVSDRLKIRIDKIMGRWRLLSETWGLITGDDGTRTHDLRIAKTFSPRLKNT